MKTDLSRVEPNRRHYAHALEARAIAMAYELHRLVGEICELPEHDAGSPCEAALDLMDEVIQYLDPDAPAGGRSPTELRP